MTVTKEIVLERLASVGGLAQGGSIVSEGLVSELFIADGKIFFSLTVPADEAERLEPMRAAAEEAARSVPGVQSAVVVLTAERSGSRKTPAPQAKPRDVERRPPEKPAVPGVASIIAVASGKGGVGKSTTAVNLALGLKANGKRVGILDADIYGPSMPKLLGIKGRPQSISGRILSPMEAYDLKVMSMGFLVEEDTPMIWRGPMVISALTQMLREVDWGELDILVVDMPPGTGDAQLTMAQQVPLAGAIIVSTPQDLALIDARKGLNMFRKVSVPLLGIVENMSYFICPDCQTRTDIFGHGGARKEAEKLEVPFLGEIPLDIGIRETSDSGNPVTATQPDGPHAAIYRWIASLVAERLDAEKRQRPPPAILFEQDD